MLFIRVKDKKSHKEEDGEKVSEREKGDKDEEDIEGNENHKEEKTENGSSNPVAVKTKDKKSGICSIF